jgi:hypothetical protein
VLTGNTFCGSVSCTGTGSIRPTREVEYGWEDAIYNLLGAYGNLLDAINVTGPQMGQAGLPGTWYECPGAYEGSRYLHVAEEPNSGTPQAYLACVSGLADGDSVRASFLGYDTTPGESPSLRIWAHYSDAATCPDCPGNYIGSAGGSPDYTEGTGWDEVSWGWVFDGSNPDHKSLVIQARLYSTPSTCDSCRTDFWIDYLTLEIPDYAHVLFPDLTGPSAVKKTTWGGIKSMYR